MAIPFGWILVLDQQKLKYRSVFIKHLLISIVVLIAGILYQKYAETENKFLVYIGSQMTFTFLILFKIVRFPFYILFKREPEISAGGGEKWPDLIVSLIVISATLAIPLLIDSLFFKKLLD
ncbi:MAG: hypothetical protein Aureis2KO_07970 [Aureisphaera sp.]